MKKRKKMAPAEMPAFPKPTLADRVNDHADMATRSVMEHHPMMKKMRADMKSAIMGVVRGSQSARGPAARGRQRSVFS